MIILLNQIVADALDECGFMMQGRIWRPSYPCFIDSIIDFSHWENEGMDINGTSSEMDLSIINVHKLGEFSELMNESHRRSFSLARIMREGSLKNVLFVVDFSVEIKRKYQKFGQNLFVSVFDSVYGNVQNVTVTGRVNLVNFNAEQYTDIVLSTFFGNVALSGQQRVYNGTGINQVQSSLKYIINDTYEVRRNTTGHVILKSLIPQIPDITDAEYLHKIHLVSCFDSLIKNQTEDEDAVYIGDNSIENEEHVDTSGLNLEPSYGPIVQKGMDIPVPKVSKAVLEKISKLPRINVSVVDPLTDSSYQIPIVIGFDYENNSNAADDYYQRSFTKSNEFDFESQYLPMYYYNFAGIPQSIMNPDEPDLEIYSNQLKTVVSLNGTMLVCNNGKFFDVNAQACVSQCQPGQCLFQSICSTECPNGFYEFVSEQFTTCYIDCPLQTGIVENPNEKNMSCVSCPDGQFATQSGCQSDTTNLKKFAKGFFKECPDGLEERDSECFEPTQCPSGQFFLNVSGHPLSAQNGFDLFSRCTSSVSDTTGLHQVMVQVGDQRLLTNEFTWNCSGIEFMNGTCLNSPDYKPNKEDCTTASEEYDEFSQVSYAEAAIHQFVGTLLVCEPICGNGLVNNNGTCTDSCPLPFYKQERYGSCNPCKSDVYDGGTYISRATQRCQKFCTHYTVGNPRDDRPKICEADCSGDTPKHVVRSWNVNNETKTNWQCVRACGDLDLLDLGGECVEKCPAGWLIDESGLSCTKACQKVVVNHEEKEGFYRMVFKRGTLEDTEKKILQGQCQTTPACEASRQTVDLKVNNVSLRCLDQCPEGQVSTRNFTCVPVDSCKFFDRLPGPLYCEDKGDEEHCRFYRKSSESRTAYICQTEECEKEEKVFQKQECVSNCLEHLQFLSEDGKTCQGSCQSGIFTKEVHDQSTSTFELKCVLACPSPKAKVNVTILDQSYFQCAESCRALGSPDLFAGKDQACRNCSVLDVSTEPPTCAESCELAAFDANLGKLVCVEACNEGQFLHRGAEVNTCVPSCAALGLFVSGSECASECVFYRQRGAESFCAEECGTDDQYLQLDGKTFCYPSCGGQVFDAASGLCVESCPVGFVQYSQVCLKACPAGYKEANGQCLTSQLQSENWLYIIFFGVGFMIISIIIILVIIYQRKKKQQGREKAKNNINRNTMYFARHLDQKVVSQKQNLQVSRTVKKIGMKVEALEYTSYTDDTRKTRNTTQKEKQVEVQDPLNTSGSSSGHKKSSARSSTSGPSGRESGSSKSQASVKIETKKAPAKDKNKNVHLISSIKTEKTGKKRVIGKLETMVI
ncbi:Growth_factor receptor cysteine-rich domain superfamily [Hexamita inflata]|uniref:Growth factor receptor cysteine-rich domain superfamily n=1 Tax=Hexamita inflata TaxID=28002 RepID=A0AA86PUT0_9EUKA|nr:Growth factor receptor cysteine-rich domain superfamily [Hexamita inflata]